MAHPRNTLTTCDVLYFVLNEAVVAFNTDEKIKHRLTTHLKISIANVMELSFYTGGQLFQPTCDLGSGARREDCYQHSQTSPRFTREDNDV